MAQRIACIVLVDIRDLMGRPPIDVIACAVHVAHVVDVSAEDIKRTVEKMIDCGHRYNNMERRLGRGICLSLGSDLPES